VIVFTSPSLLSNTCMYSVLLLVRNADCRLKTADCIPGIKCILGAKCRPQTAVQTQTPYMSSKNLSDAQLKLLFKSSPVSAIYRVVVKIHDP